MVSGSLPLSPGKAKVKRMLEGKEREEDLETIEALPLGSDAEMKREFVEIGGLAADAKNPEWVLRVKALQRFRRLVAGGCHDLGMFMTHMKEYMKEPLIAAVQDLRSAVSKEACHAVTHLCRTLPPEKWEAMSDWFLPALFKISVVTIAVISQSSSRCLRYILRKGRVSHRAVFVALDPQNFENKHATYRQTVYQTIFSLLHKMPSDTFLARELDLVVRALRQGLADPMPEVRRISRLLYWATYYMIPDRVEDIFDALDQAGQKNVLEEKAVYDGLQDAVGVEWECLPRAPPASPKVGTGGGASGLPSAATAPDLRHVDSTLPHTPSKADTSARLVRPGGRGGGAAPHGNKDRSTTPLPRRATSGAVTPAKSGRRTPSKPAPAAATTMFDDIDATMESSVFLDDSGVFNTPPPPGGNAKRRPGGSGPAAARRPKQQQQQQAPPPTAASLRTLQFTTIEMGEPSDDDLSSSAASRKDSWAGGAGASATVEEILAMESKAAACRMLGRLVLEEDVELHGVRQKVNTIAEYLAGSMEEGRRNTSQVVAAAFRAFGAYAEAFQDTAALEPHFERVFSLIFPRLGAPSTHAEALSLLEKLLECGHTRVLVPVLLRVLNSSSDKVQLGCLEYMLHLIQFSREFLLKPANMETCICKFAHLANSPNYNVKNASVTCLGLLHSTSPQLFCEAVLQMTQGEQRTMKEVLHSTVPTLADQIEGGVYNPPTRAASAAASRHADPATHAPQRSSAANGVSSSADASAAAAARARKAKKPAAGSVSPAAPPPQQQQQQQLPKSPARRLPGKAGHTSGPAHRSKTPTPQPETAAAATTLAFKKIGSSAPKRPAASRGGSGGGAAAAATAAGPKPLSILTQDVLDTGSLAAARELAGACATAPLSHVREALAELPSLVLQDDLDEEVRVCIIDASVAMIRRLNPTRATPSVRSFFALCLNCYCDPVPKVSEHAQDGLFNLVQTISSVCAMELLTAELTTRGPLSQDEEVPFLFRILESFLSRVGSQNPQELLEMAESGGVAALVHAGINSERADVRKAVVFCFVALYVSLGSACVPLLKPLTTSQLKLITIYVNRKQGKPDQAALAQ